MYLFLHPSQPITEPPCGVLSCPKRALGPPFVRLPLGGRRGALIEEGLRLQEGVVFYERNILGGLAFALLRQTFQLPGVLVVDRRVGVYAALAADDRVVLDRDGSVLYDAEVLMALGVDRGQVACGLVVLCLVFDALVDSRALCVV